MRNDELKSRGRQWDVEFQADAFEFHDPLHDVFGCGRVVVLGSSLRPGRKNAGVESAADGDGRTPIPAQRQKLV